MVAGKASLYGLLVFTGLVAVGGGAMMFFSRQDEGQQWVLMLVLLFFAVLAPLPHMLHRPAFRAGGILLCVLFLTMTLLLGLVYCGFVDSSKFYGTMMVLLYTGIPAGVALLLRRKPWGAAFTWTLFPISMISMIVSLWAIFHPGDPDSSMASRPFFAALALLVYGAPGAVLLINVGRGDRRYFRWPGIVLSLAAVGLGVFSAAVGSSWSDPIPHASRLCALVAFTLAFINLILMTNRPGLVRWIQWITIGSALVAGFSALVLHLLEGREEGIVQVVAPGLAGAPGAEHLAAMQWLTRLVNGSVMFMVGSVVCLIIAREILRLKPPATAPAGIDHVQITCPNCSTAQRVGLKGACKHCLLQFKIQLVEPRCPQCDHLLLNLTQSERCPECGAAFKRPGVPATVEAAGAGGAAGTSVG